MFSDDYAEADFHLYQTSETISVFRFSSIKMMHKIHLEKSSHQRRITNTDTQYNRNHIR